MLEHCSIGCVNSPSAAIVRRWNSRNLRQLFTEVWNIFNSNGNRQNSPSVPIPPMEQPGEDIPIANRNRYGQGPSINEFHKLTYTEDA